MRKYWLFLLLLVHPILAWAYPDNDPDVPNGGAPRVHNQADQNQGIGKPFNVETMVIYPDSGWVTLYPYQVTAPGDTTRFLASRTELFIIEGSLARRLVANGLADTTTWQNPDYHDGRGYGNYLILDDDDATGWPRAETLPYILTGVEVKSLDADSTIVYKVMF